MKEETAIYDPWAYKNKYANGLHLTHNLNKMIGEKHEND